MGCIYFETPSMYINEIMKLLMINIGDLLKSIFVDKMFHDFDAIFTVKSLFTRLIEIWNKKGEWYKYLFLSCSYCLVYFILLCSPGSVMTNKLDLKTCKSEFESHWVLYSFSQAKSLVKYYSILLLIEYADYILCSEIRLSSLSPP